MGLSQRVVTLFFKVLVVMGATGGGYYEVLKIWVVITNTLVMLNAFFFIFHKLGVVGRWVIKY